MMDLSRNQMQADIYKKFGKYLLLFYGAVGIRCLFPTTFNLVYQEN